MKVLRFSFLVVVSIIGSISVAENQSYSACEIKEMDLVTRSQPHIITFAGREDITVVLSCENSAMVKTFVRSTAQIVTLELAAVSGKKVSISTESNEKGNLVALSRVKIVF